MGLLDILNGMQNGPGGAPRPTPPGQSKGMSPLMMALLGLLAYKAIKGGGLENIFGGKQAAPAGNPQPGGLGDILAGNPGSPQPGGLGDILGGMLGGGPQQRGPAAGPGGLGDILGGLFGGAAAGTTLNGGLRNLLEDMENTGQGDIAKSWIGRGENREVAPDDLAKALGADTIAALSSQTGMPREQLLSELSQNLPQFVDQLTPDGRVPTDDESSRWV
jgi:uncharacterized protein YidB (DUF937 family)